MVIPNRLLWPAGTSLKASATTALSKAHQIQRVRLRHPWGPLQIPCHKPDLDTEELD
jgi:hypothetical protein